MRGYLVSLLLNAAFGSVVPKLFQPSADLLIAPCMDGDGLVAFGGVAGCDGVPDCESDSLIFFRAWMDRAVGPIHYFDAYTKARLTKRNRSRLAVWAGSEGCSQR